MAEQTTEATGPLWCTSFDMDLPAVIPEAMSVLAPVADVVLWVHCRPTNGRINCPAAWNTDKGLASFFGLAGDARPAGYYSDSPLVRCTFAETVRDLWIHGHVLCVERVPVWNPSRKVQHLAFMPIMGHIRGYGPLPSENVAAIKAAVCRSLAKAVGRFQAVLDLCPGLVEREAS